MITARGRERARARIGGREGKSIFQSGISRVRSTCTGSRSVLCAYSAMPTRVFRYRPYIRPALIRGNFFGKRRLGAVMRGLPRNWRNWQSAQLARVSRRRERLIVASPVGLNSPLTLKRDALSLYPRQKNQ